MPLLVALVAVAGVTTASPIPADEVVLKPSGKWAVDYADTRCVASRSFGDPSSPVVLGVRPSLNETTVRLIIARNSGYLTPRHLPVTVAGTKASALYFSATGTRQRLMRIDLTRADFDRAAAGRSLRVEGEGMNIDLALTGIASAVKALQTYNADLRKHWNRMRPGWPG
jgi:hypothetical protein